MVLCAISLVAVSRGGDPMGVDLEVSETDPSSQSWADVEPTRGVARRAH